ncbi:MAG TPA: VCBS repeat-containing protein [Longimicrobium sp.]|nr:VCBS repeat-containing protein [Longimicrobium sp.]
MVGALIALAGCQDGDILLPDTEPSPLSPRGPVLNTTSGTTYAGWVPMVSAESGDWQMGGVADMTADGKPDVVWYNRVTRQAGVWVMDWTTYRHWVPIAPVESSDWEIGGVADMTGDGKPDIFWHNRVTRRTGVWVMNGTAYDRWIPTGAVESADWQIGGVADMNANGSADVVWYNRVTRQTGVWLMNGTTYDRWVPMASPESGDWQMGAVGDMTGDGKPDIVWQNRVTRQVGVWVMNGTTYLGWIELVKAESGDWEIGGVAQMAGDRSLDVVWQNRVTRQTGVWVMGVNTLRPVAAVPGTVIDADAGRVLYAYGTAVRIRNLSSGADTDVMMGTVLPGQGFLSPNGAIMLSGSTVYEFRNGVLTQVGSPGPLRVTGTFAAYIRDGVLIRHDLTSGATVPVTTDFGSPLFGVGPNGDVVFHRLTAPNSPSTTHQIFRFRDGTLTPLATFESPPVIFTRPPVTDGINVVYVVPTTVAGYSGVYYRLGAVLASGANLSLSSPAGDVYYRANGGFIAYTDAATPNSNLLLFLRSPNGSTRQVNGAGESSGAEALTPAGDLVFHTFTAARRYLAVPGSTTLTDLGPALGGAIERGGILYVVVEGEVFQVVR